MAVPNEVCRTRLIGFVLRCLYQDSAEENREYAKGLARLIQRHAPLLEELSVGRDELSNAVAEAYKQERMETRCINEVTMFDA